MGSKKDDIKKMVSIFNTNLPVKNLMDLFLSNIIADEVLRQKLNDLFFTKKNLDVLADSLVAIYSRHFNHNEIKEIIRFYESSIGLKFRNKLPLLTEEAGKSGEVWAIKMMNEMKDEVEKIMTEHVGLSQQEEPKDKKTTKTFDAYGFGGLTSVGKKTKEEIKNDIGRSLRIHKERYKFAHEYAERKGWEFNVLTDEQIDEIKSQDEWKNAGKEDEQSK